MSAPLQQQIDAIEAATLGLKHWLSITEARAPKDRTAWENSIRATRDRIADFEAVAKTLRWLQTHEPTIKQAVRG